MNPIWTVVLDDDPTGTQGIADVPVIIHPTDAAFDWAFDQGDTVYVLTNTRALSADEARGVVDVASRKALRAAVARGGDVRFVSRGDSTLRGHFPLELDTIRSMLPYPVRGTILVPAFPEAGRLTLAGVHYVRQGGVLIPVGESEYATDSTFGYSTSVLTDWVAERVHDDVTPVDLPTSVVGDGARAIADFLQAQPEGVVVCPSVRSDDDLAVLAEGQLLAEREGVRYLVHAAPSYPRHLAGLPSGVSAHPSVGAGSGLVVVGSHTETTTAQLTALVDAYPTTTVELDVPALLAAHGDDEIRRTIDVARAALTTGLVILATSRERIATADASESLRIANRVAEALVIIVRELLPSPPAYVIAKGGITSRDVVAESLGWDAATVEGPLVDATLPVWKRAGSHEGQDPVAVIFPGNVGRADLLARAVARLEDLRDPALERIVS